ncbi:MAG TPA: aspartate aminotransferase family protein [Desulfuromonadales bacterium]|nr:aspartate aminotransferase family protein [Desulfuromonadales bacterium]
MNTQQKKMFTEIQDKSLFEQAQKHAFQYLDEAFQRTIFPTEDALEKLSIFDEDMPQNQSEGREVIELLHQYGSPATVPAIGGRYFGFVTGSSLPTGLAAKHLATYWDQNSAMYVMSPLASKLESVVESWLKSIFHLPDTTVAGFVSGTSSANLCGLAAARNRLLRNQHWDVNSNGLFGAPNIRAVAGCQAHSTVIKAIGLLGFGQNSIEFVEVDDQGRIIPDLIPELDNRTLLILQAGNVNSGSFDDFSRICEKARNAGAWIHIDGAFGLWAGAAEQLKHLTQGMEFAHSWAVDGHKTLNTPYDCGIIMCADREALTEALHMTGSYIVVSKDRDGMFYTPEMSRRARIVELWATLKYLGASGIDQMITTMHERAVQFADEISALDGFTVLNQVVFNQVVVCCDSDEITNKVLEKIQALRECWVGGSVWQGRRVIRVSVCSWATTSNDIATSVRSFAKAQAMLEIIA